MLDLIIAGIVWVVIPILISIVVVSVILNEIDAEKNRKAHRKYLLDAIDTSNMDDGDKAEIICKFVNCGRN